LYKQLIPESGRQIVNGVSERDHLGRNARATGTEEEEKVREYEKGGLETKVEKTGLAQHLAGSRPCKVNRDRASEKNCRRGSSRKGYVLQRCTLGGQTGTKDKKIDEDPGTETRNGRIR